jgi:hypothetical protein
MGDVVGAIIELLRAVSPSLPKHVRVG